MPRPLIAPSGGWANAKVVMVAKDDESNAFNVVISSEALTLFLGQGGDNHAVEDVVNDTPVLVTARNLTFKQNRYVEITRIGYCTSE